MNYNSRTSAPVPQRSPSHLNSLLGASLITLSKMVSVQPSSISPESVDVIITFRNESSPIYIATDVMGWQPQLMTSTNGEAYEHVITVPKQQRTLLYKFRIGDNHWVHDASVSAEPDNLGGFNNRFEIPDISYPESNIAPSECSEATELESVAAVESVADTVSEVADDESGVSHDEADFIDVDDVISEPDFPTAYTDTSSSASSLRQLLSFGVRSRY
ncbi:hypothetical protein, variant 1 [Verruconis gallopava]|uniref:AMP-activated protein kinase glycogen-binding domain-containing protein n=1 Tax=Verruconis gallopava TaxID=253628 RepID=A0A0D1XEQ8_9PEZI|nr:hypothetical protein, variant 1 [Verruconis gallopava]KIW00691.1 hypothetical protein, variant 1 [Verruconis gallopava]